MQHILLNQKAKQFYCFLIIAFMASFSANAQTFNPTTTTETTHPTSPMYPVPPFSAVPGVYCNAHISTMLGTPGDPMGNDAQIAEVAAWTEDDSNGWENGYFTYGYTTSSGVYIATGHDSIPSAKHLSAAYMTDGVNGYIIAAYVSRQHLYDWRIQDYDTSTHP